MCGGLRNVEAKSQLQTTFPRHLSPDVQVDRASHWPEVHKGACVA